MPHPTGTHPIYLLACRLANGEIGAAEALRQAGTPAVASVLDGETVKTLTATADDLRCKGRWQHAIQLMQVLLAALDAAPSDVVPESVRDMAETVWVECVGLALWHAPDPRLYHQALARGQRVTVSAHGRGDRCLHCDVLRALASLYLEPFSRHRLLNDLEAFRGDWARRLYEGETWDGERAPEAPEGPFPEPADAMRQAERYLREALDVCEGKGRALALYALVTVFDLRRQLGDPAPKEEVIAISHQALAEFETQDDPARVVGIVARLQEAGAEVDYGIVGRVLAMPFEQLKARYGMGDTITLLLNVALIMKNAGKGAERLHLLVHYGPLFDSNTQGELRRRWLKSLRSALRDAFIGGYTPPSEGTVKTAFAALQQRGEDEKWDFAQTGAVLLALAERTHETQEEMFGIELLNRVEQIQPFSDHPLALHALRGLLWRSAASRLAPDVPDQALACYGKALADAVEVKDPVETNYVLAGIRQAVVHADAPGLATLVSRLTPLARQIELLLGEPGTKHIQEVAGAASLRIVQKVRDGALMHDLLRIAKGLRFGAMLTSGSVPRYKPNARAAATLGKIESMLASTDEVTNTRAASDKLNTFGEFLLVSPQTESAVHLGGESGAETLANVQHQFDVALDRTLTSLATDELLHTASAAALPDLLDDETVLLEYYLTNTGDTELLVLLLRSTEGVELSAVQLGKDTAQKTFVFDGITCELSEIAATVLNLRRAVNEAPASGPLSQNAQERLTRDSALLLGNPIRWQKLRAQGKRHLCIVPNGALHVAPLHLLLIDGRPLAKDWLVTYLPNMCLVARDPDDRPTATRKRMLTAIGVSFTDDNPFQLPTLKNVESEVRAVARTFGVVPVLDPEGTKKAIFDALEQSRFVHIATHGAHNPFAASFQCLYCARGDGGDGRLFAHELLGRDLRGLELVTLSACETALGRFDLGDNLHGLPAALFLAGVRTIIGTLWDLETNAAETFFTALYGAIERGARKSDAFAEAQRTTRTQHPEFRDWGAFYFAGDWR